MAVHSSIWKRIGSLFTSETAAVPAADGDGPVTVTAQAVKPSEGHLELSGGSGNGRWWQRWPNRKAASGELAMRFVELSAAMQEHFRRQDERAAELAGALDRVGRVLEQLAQTQQSQGECLRTIAEHAAAAGKNTASLADALGRIPESLLTQAEAIRTVAMQLDLAQETDTQLLHSLQQFGRAIDALGSSGGAQVAALQNLSAAQREQQAAFSNLVRVQTRRYAIVLVVVGALGIATLIGLGWLVAARLPG